MGTGWRIATETGGSRATSWRQVRGSQQQVRARPDRRLARASGVLALTLAVIAGVAPALPQPRKPEPPSLSASRSVMAGTMLQVLVSGGHTGTVVAIARPQDAPADAFVSVPPDTRGTARITTPGAAGFYELRLLREDRGVSTILARQPLAAAPPEATLAAPARVRAGATFRLRGTGPNGDRDRVVLARPEAPPEADGPSFLPAENIEASLEAPDMPGRYELRYVMNAPLSGRRILASRALIVE